MVATTELDIEKDKKIESSSPSVAQESQTHAPKHPGKTFANRTFNIANYFGIGWIVNSSLSLLIAYNILPTDEVQTGIKKSASIMKPVMAAVDKVKGLFGMSKLTGKTAAEQEHAIMESARSATEILCMFVAGCMVLPVMKWAEDHKQGIVSWIDRKWNRKYYQQCEQYKQDCEAKGITPEAEPAPSDGNKQTWGKLLTARVVGMGIVLAGDNRVQAWNNKHTAFNTDINGWKAGSWLENKILPTSWRNRIIKTFSTKGVSVEGIQPQMRERLLDYISSSTDLQAMKDRIEQLHKDMMDPTKSVAVENEFTQLSKQFETHINDSKKLGGIIDQLAALNERVAKDPRLESASFFQRRGVLKTLNQEVEVERKALIDQINHNPHFRELTEKAIFSEQARLVSKEVGWTLVMAGMIFAFSKTGALSWALKKVGLKKDDKPTNAEWLLQDAPLLPVSDGDENMIRLEARNGKSEHHAPAVASASHTQSVITPAPAASPTALESLKSKKILPTENHTDLAKAGEPNLQLGA